MDNPKIFVSEIIRNTPYKQAAVLADQYGLSVRTVKRRAEEIRDQIGRRYKKQAIIDDGNIVLINEYVFLDWLSNRQQINSKHKVEDFNVFDWVESYGNFKVPTREIM